MSQQENNAVEKYAAVVERMGLPIEGDVAELSKAPVGGLMGWHELAVIVRHIEEGVGYNYPKLAANLCQHLGYAKAALATTTEQLAAAAPLAEEMQRVLREGGKGSALLIWCLRYGDEADLNYVFDKLSRRCPAGKALVERAEKAEQQLAAARQEGESRFGELRGKVTSLLEDLANGCEPVKMEPGVKTTPYWLGVNTERANTLRYAELKCKELGIAWPIKPIPYASDLPAAPAQVAVAPPVAPDKPTCWCQTCLTAYGNTLSALDRIRLLGKRMIVCPDCGNKRCPKANYHGNACTNSNEVGQKGSSWENVKPFAERNSGGGLPLERGADAGQKGGLSEDA